MNPLIFHPPIECLQHGYKRSLKKRIAYLGAWGIALFALLMTQAHSQPPTPQEQLHRMVDVYPSLQIASLALLPNADNALGIENIQAMPPESFSELPPRQLRINDPTWNRSLWLKITLRAHEPVANRIPSASSILEIQKPFLDQLALYTPSGKPGAGWQVQRSGDTVAKELWSLPGQFARFILPSVSDLQTLPGGQMVVYLHVPHRNSASFDLKISSAVEMVDDIQRDYLLFGVTFGFMLFAMFLSMALFVFHRDALFVWYAIYATCILLVSMSHSGLAFQYLWPWGGMWPSKAAICFVLIAFSAQLQFYKMMFTPSERRTRLAVWSGWLGGISIASAIALAVASQEFFMSAYLVCLGLMMACLLLSSALIARACWRGNPFAIVSALTFLPVFVSVMMLLGNISGFIGLTEFGYNALLYAFAMEVALLSLCLIWFGHHRHGQKERQNALAETDPLTGFVTKQAFQTQLQRDWEISTQKRTPLAVAYVKLQTRPNNDEHLQQLLTRCVRILRSATSAQDLVARLDGSLMALLMHDVPAGDDLSQRLSRIVALGLMPDASDRAVNVLQFRIAATTNQQFDKPLTQLDAQMRELLAQPNGWGSKPIRYIDHTRQEPANPFVLESVALEETWEAAFKQEMKATGAQKISGSS